MLGDFEISDLADDPLRKLTGVENRDIIEHFPRDALGFFARDGGGGELALWLWSPDPPSSPTVDVRYEGTPYSVTYEGTELTVRDVTIYGGREIVRLPQNFEPLLATKDEAWRWLRANDPACTDESGELISAALGLSMSTRWGTPRRAEDAKTRWVDSIRVSFGKRV